MIAAQKKKNIGNLSRHFHNSKCNQKVTDCNRTKNEKTLEIQGFDWWSVGGSNPWPQDCEPCALPAELTPRATNILTDYESQKIKKWSEWQDLNLWPLRP